MIIFGQRFDRVYNEVTVQNYSNEKLAKPCHYSKKVIVIRWFKLMTAYYTFFFIFYLKCLNNSYTKTEFLPFTARYI